MDDKLERAFSERSSKLLREQLNAPFMQKIQHVHSMNDLFCRCDTLE